jgi:peroxiredoxin
MIFDGEAFPLFRCWTRVNPTYAFGSVGGRYVLVVVHGSSEHPEAAQALQTLRAAAARFDPERAVAFGVSMSQGDLDAPLTQDLPPALRFFFDQSGAVCTQLGLYNEATQQLRTAAYLLDPTLRVIHAAGLHDLPKLLAHLKTLPDPVDHAGTMVPAPILVVPRIFEPEFCRKLIDYGQSHEIEDSGFMQEENGLTVRRLDHGFKQRGDVTIEDQDLCAAARTRVRRRLIPQIEKAFQFKVTRMERYIVARYTAGTEESPGGFFRAHRDNTTKGTAHRRFAVTINLNAEDYDGGNIRFPEYGPTAYRAPTGGAVVFSCSLLHEALPVTRGTRYAFLPFLYDDAAAKIRLENNKFLAADVGEYAE